MLILISILLQLAQAEAADSSQTMFRDVASEAGVDHFGRGRGAAFGDYDNDGDLDIYAGCQQKDGVLYRNNGDGTFSDVTAHAGLAGAESPYGTVFGDYDNDGYPDLYITRGGFAYVEGKTELLKMSNILYHNNGDGTFTDVTYLAGVGDRGAGFAGVFGDYDNDGYLDIYVANLGQDNVLYRNNGDGTFTDATRAAGTVGLGNGVGSTWGDYDNDGYLDIYVACIEWRNVLYHNKGDGTFTNVTDVAGVRGTGRGFATAFGDYDNDGYLDIYVTTFNDKGDEGFDPGYPNTLYHNNGDGTFTDVSAKAGVDYIGGSMGVAFGDYDYDGYLDIYVGNGGPEEGRAEPDLIYRNNGDGTFTDVAAQVGAGDMRRGHGIVFGDYDGDGDLDIYVSMGGFLPDDEEANILYRNEGNDNNWLIVKTVGTRSNRDGIGVRVTVTSGTLFQAAEVNGGSGFCSQNSLPVEFGLGKNSYVDKVQIQWPSGKVQVLENVASNQILTVIEPRGILGIKALFLGGAAICLLIVLGSIVLRRRQRRFSFEPRD